MDLYRGCLCGLIALVLLCTLLPVDGGCAEKAQCCKGKNNKCRAFGPRMNRSNRTTCFCDEHCLSTGDCCTDFKAVCKPTNCVLDDWGEWGECSKRCGWGSKERLRRVLVERRNGGDKCGQTRQRVYCYGTKCKVERAQGGEAIRETGKIIPAMYGPWRKNKLYNPYSDIRKNLFHHYSANSIIDRPAYRARFEITEVRRGCEIHQGSGWTKDLKTGQTVCVECQPFAMKRKLGVRCKGHGVYHRETRWSAIMVSGCRGKWRMVEKAQDGGCDPEKEVSFIFV